MELRKSPGIIVLGGHVQGYGIVRVFGENNIPSVVIDRTTMNIARHSKYCTQYFKSPYEKIVELLLSLGKNHEYQGWLIYPTDDYYVRILSKNKLKLNKYFRVTVDEWNVIDLFFNKRNSYPLVESVNVPIPQTSYPNSIDELQSNAKSVSFPCIIKPAIMLDFYRVFRKKVFICKNEIELLANYRKALTVLKPEEIIIQEIIPGSNENQYSVGVFFDRNKSYNYLVGRRKRQHPVDFGNATTFAETTNNHLLIEYAHKILAKANFCGLCEVEFKYDKRDGQYKFLEVNPRTWKWHLISERANIPFLLSTYNYFIDGNPIIKTNYKESGWRDIITDIAVILILIRKKAFRKSMTKNIASAVANRQDIKPFIYQILYFPNNIFVR